MSPRSLGEPRIQVAIDELDHAVAALADQVVVMPVAAEAVARLSRVMVERINGTGFAESGQRPVHGRQPDASWSAGEGGVDLLCGRVVPFRGKHPEDGHPLPGRPQAVPQKELDGVRLRPGAHVPYASDR